MSGEVRWETIPQLIDDAVARFGDLEALVEGDRRWTYTQLTDDVRRTARALIGSGIAAGDRVGIWAPNIAQWVTTALAIHSVGAVLVPVNTRFKGREAAFVLGKAKVRLLFTVTDFLDADYVEMIRGAAADPDASLAIEEIVVLAGSERDGATALDTFLERGETVTESQRDGRAAAVQPGDVCHILFTSGTTGAPKGALLTHGAVCRAYDVCSDVIDLRAGDRHLIVNPFFHSFGLHVGILGSVMRGACMVPHLVFDPGVVLQRIAEERISIFPGPPAVYLGMLNHPDVASFDLSSLRVSVLGTASISEELIEQMRTRLGMPLVVTGYGITEASGIATMNAHDSPPEAIARTAGRPLPGVTIRVVDSDGHDVSPGQPGELLVKGYNLMLGYLDDPEQTAKAIDPDGWLHTGDVVLVRADGNMVVTDRIKDMYIVGGFNVSPAEVENLLLTHPHIGQVAVVGIPDGRMGEVGIAYVIPRPGTIPDPDEIIAWSRAEMANYKVPRRVILTDVFPTNATGKVLKYALRTQATTN